MCRPVVKDRQGRFLINNKSLKLTNYETIDERTVVMKTGGLSRSFKCYYASYTYNRVAVNTHIYYCRNFMET